MLFTVMLGKKLLVLTATIALLASGMSNVNVYDARAETATLDTDKDEISLGQDLTIILNEPDANIDSRTVDKIPLSRILLITDKFDETPLDKVLEVTGIEASQLNLRETGPNTGIFEVTLQSINSKLADRNSEITIVYFDNTPSGGGPPVRVEKVVNVTEASIAVKFSKHEYTPFDTVEVTLIAQMFNINRNKIDTINTPGGGKVAITTDSGQIYYPPMFETGVNTGVFVGKIKLTSDPDSKKGDLVVNGGDRIRVIVTIVPGFELSDSAVITTTLGKISFDRSSYATGDTVKVIVTDPDENRDPAMIDTVQVRVWSSTDIDGMTLTLHETGASSGAFEGKFMPGGRSNGTLYVSDNDMIFAEYRDRTVPSLTKPFTKDVFASTKIGSPPNADILISEPSLVDQNGTYIQNVEVGKLIAVQSSLTNSRAETHQFVYITDIKDRDGFTVELAFVTGTLESYQSLKVGRSWVPDHPGKYTVEVFVWDSITKPSKLSPVKISPVTVKE